jgi:hypothetical protein
MLAPQNLPVFGKCARQAHARFARWTVRAFNRSIGSSIHMGECLRHVLHPCLVQEGVLPILVRVFAKCLRFNSDCSCKIFEG